MHEALEREEFVVYYQPRVNVNTGQIVGMEALLRWQHPEQGMIPPLEFIPLAEETGLIIPIGEWVLRTACAQNKAWQQAGFPPLRVSVNISAVQLKQKNFIKMVSQVLKETGLQPCWLELEITESTVMKNAEIVIIKLRQLREIGVSISLDDFGSGFSSLSYLRQFPVNKLKIDQSFIRNVVIDPNDASIVTMVIMLGQSLKLGVTAEGVETNEQFSFLKERHCEEMQGYLISKPLPAGEFEIMLNQRTYKKCR